MPLSGIRHFQRFPQGDRLLPIALQIFGFLPTRLKRSLLVSTVNCHSVVPPRCTGDEMPKLTKRVIDAANGNSLGEIFLWDAEVKGFGVRIKPSGAKSFVLKYRIGTKTRRYTISKVGSPYTVEEARQISADLLRGIRAGLDPMQAKAAKREALTVAELAEDRKSVV